ncbi:sugar transferase [Odoribacter sp. OttesenSCG-928-A06]|nr:sugar transferase [Odoribacter sp. OttesenSCG-928-A06]
MFYKFLFDRFASFFGLIILSPLLLCVAILIHIKMSGGPVIFKQKRVGQYGKLFTMYKFRSMNVVHSGNSVSVKGENRITPLGAKLRKYKLDELPELWNILKGDMSFVGPRPDVPGYADKLKGEDKRILELKPGITGPASLKYRNEEELLSLQNDPVKYNDEVIYPDKIRINLYYLCHWNFWLDIKIIICTLLGKDLDQKYY